MPAQPRSAFRASFDQSLQVLQAPLVLRCRGPSRRLSRMVLGLAPACTAWASAWRSA